MDKESVAKVICKDLLKKDGYWQVSKRICVKYGADAAIAISDLINAEEMLADKDGWFYQTQKTVENHTGLTRRKQDRVYKTFEKAGIIVKDVRGIDKETRRFFRIDYEKLFQELTGEKL